MGLRRPLQRAIGAVRWSFSGRPGILRLVWLRRAPLAVAAITVNASANCVPVAARVFDLAQEDAGDAEVVLAGDVFYQRQLAELALSFLRAAAGAGAEVLVADPGRAFVPVASLTALARYAVPVLTTIEDAPVKTVTVYRLGGNQDRGRT